MKKGWFTMLAIMIIAGATLVWLSNDDKIDRSETTLGNVFLNKLKGNITGINYINFREDNVKLKSMDVDSLSEITNVLSSIKLKEITYKEYRELSSGNKDDFNLYFIVGENLGYVMLNENILLLNDGSEYSRKGEVINKAYEITMGYDYEKIKNALEK